jgi:hypothetical protein
VGRLVAETAVSAGGAGAGADALGVLTGTPAHSVEQGEKKYDEEALRQGARNFLKEYGKYRPLTINLGNEPHGTGERVLANVRAYKIIYEEVKKYDATIPVVASRTRNTSRPDTVNGVMRMTFIFTNMQMTSARRSKVIKRS